MYGPVLSGLEMSSIIIIHLCITFHQHTFPFVFAGKPDIIGELEIILIFSDIIYIHLLELFNDLLCSVLCFPSLAWLLQVDRSYLFLEEHKHNFFSS